MNRKRLALLPLLAALCLAWALTACVSDSSGGGGGGLASGHYFIQNDGDGTYIYNQYFVVLAGGKWEFVEYGTTPSGSELCQLTRQGGSYALRGDSMAVTGTRSGASIEKCPITKSDFDAYAFQATSPVTQSFPIRNVTDSSFDAENLFVGSTGWKTYRRAADPYGFYP